MSIKTNNPNLVKARAEFAKANTGIAEPMFNAMQYVAFAYRDKALADRDDFRKFILSLREKDGVPTLAENRMSERWNVAQLGGYACVTKLFANLGKMKKKPSITALADIAACIGGRGPWAKGGQFATAKVRAWPVEREDAPTTEALTTMMQQGNKARNKTKVDVPRTDADVIGGMITACERLNNRKHKSNGKEVDALNNSDITKVIALLKAVKNSFDKSKNGKSNVIKLPTRKAAA